MPFRAVAEARDEEKLREALLELERAREREEQARADTSILLDAMEAMARAPSPAAAVSALLARVATAFGADAAAILRPGAGDSVAAAHATDADLVGARWREAAPRIRKPRRLIEIDHDRLGGPDALRDYRSMMSTPLTLGESLGAENAGALACFSRARAGFTAPQLTFLGRLGGLAAQALAAQTLWERHAMLGGVIEGGPNALAIFDARDAERRCVYANPAFARIAGQDATELHRAPLRALLQEGLFTEDAAGCAALSDAVAACEATTLELRARRPDGTSSWIRLTLFPVGDHEGRVRHLVVTQADITERRAAERERDAARAQLDSALSSTREGFAVLGPDGAVAYVNAAFAGFYPVNQGWRAGADFARLWGESRGAAGLAKGDPNAEGRRRRDWAFSSEPAFEDLLPDGRALLVSATRTSDHGAVVTVADVTGMKRAEARLAERAAVIEAAQDGIALTDAEGRFRYMNPSHLAMFGFTRQAEIVGMSWDALYEPADAERIRQEAFPALDQTGGWRGEAIGRRRDGAPLEQEISLTLLPDGGLVCVTRDISDRRRSERERLRLRDEVQTAQRREAVGQVAAGVAHDFNNLLSAISGSAALAGLALGPGSPAAPHLDRIGSAAESGADLMRRLMDLGARKKRRVRFDLAEPLRNVADLVSAGAGLRVSVETDLPPTPIMVEADPGDVLHLALNLGINARDALGADGGKVALGLRRAAAGDLARKPLLGVVDPGRDYAVIRVSDDGCGVPEAVAVEMFKPHVSTKGDAGTGLGLAIVAGVIAENDAALSLSSAPGEGSEFEILWPLRAGPASASRDAAANGEADAAAVRSLGGRTILVAEDSPETLEAIAAFLGTAGAEVAPCDDAVAAAEAIEDDPEAWDLLITDLEMPGLDGAGLAARARAAAPKTPVILCTGAPDSVVDGFRNRFDAVIRKPVTRDQVVSAARRALDGAQQRS